MAKRIRKAVKFGTRVAAAAKKKLDKQMRMLVKSGIINRGEAKKLFRAIAAEVRTEKERIKQFAKQELKRGLKKAKPLVKRAVSRLRRKR